MNSLWNRTAAELLHAASSQTPTPGGGSTAALTAAFGAALLHMAAVISLNKARRAGHAEHHSERQAQLAELERLQHHLRDLADQDVAVFRAFVDATRLPESTPEEQQAKAAARAEAAQAARATPLDIARRCHDALRLAEAVLPVTHAEVVSDVGAGAALLRGAAEAALLTFDINLRPLPGEERAPLWQVRLTLAEEIGAAAQRVLEASQRRILAEET